ncbi:MAG: glycosyltransferase family 4 protein, partial [Candidatus Omnitrophica bacterium]|nr:glycosyltransferase family 4 protein [Candidatus Omnitrophota bacterium]
MNYKVNFISFKMKHHSNHSGYDRLVHFISGNGSGSIKSNVPWALSRLVPSRVKEAIKAASGVSWYSRHHLINELKAGLKLFSFKNEVFHFLYGEDSYCYLGFLPRRKNKKIVCTYHQPPDYFETVIRKKNHLRKLDAIIALSKAQYDYFKSLIGRDKVFLLPHGVDTDFFVPSQNTGQNGALRCLFVGQWLRDFMTLKRVIQTLNFTDKDVRFDIVTTQEYKTYFNALGNVSVYSGITDKELLGLYQKATVLVMPLLDCTANNSILEALACGLPVVATDVGGVRQYLDETCGILVSKKDPKAMADEVIELFENKPLRKAMSEKAREKALSFSW